MFTRPRGGRWTAAPVSSARGRLSLRERHSILRFFAARDVLSRPELQIRKRLRQQIEERSHSVPSRRLEVTRDPDDNMFLECADVARADCLVTGSAKHFPKFWKGTKVITSREFLSLVAPHLLG